MRKYNTAPESNSLFVPISDKIGSERTSAAIATVPEIIRQSNNAVCIASAASLCFFAPRKYAVTTFIPAPSPIRIPVNNKIKVEVEPTAPSANAPANLPTTAISAILKSTCNKFDSIKGTLKLKIFLYKFPLHISILQFIFFQSLISCDILPHCTKTLNEICSIITSHNTNLSKLSTKYKTTQAHSTQKGERVLEINKQKTPRI